MKKKLFIIGATASICFSIMAMMAFTEKSTETKTIYKQITTIESVVPGGFGRSRIISTDVAGSKMEEIHLKNFYSLVGINFKNIMHNDAVITDKLAKMTNDGWELEHITSGVESADEKTGLFITRYLFKKKVEK